MINILIADNNSLHNIELANNLSKQKEFKIIYQALNEKDTYAYYAYCNPDVLLLNADIMSNDTHNLIEKIHSNDAISNKIDVILYYPKKITPLIGKKNKIYSIYNSNNDYTSFENDIFSIYEKNKKPNYREFISNILVKLGFTLSNYGTQFIIDATLFIFENNITLFKIKDIYNELEKIHSIPAKQIKWNIESSINSMWHYSSVNIRSIFIDYDDERKLSPKYLISLILSKLPK